MSASDITTDAQLTPWQKKTLELARSMVNERNGENFIPHINFVELYEDDQNADTRIHNLGHIIPWIEAITRNAGSIIDAVVFGPPRNLIGAIIDRLVIMGNTNDLTIIFPESYNVCLTRTAAIVAITSRVPHD